MLKSISAGILVRLVLLLLLIYAIFGLVHTQQQITATRNEISILTEQVADQEEANTIMSNAIENSDDPSYIRDVARERLDLVTPDDKVFYTAD